MQRGAMARATGLDLVRVCAALSVFLFHGRLFAGVALGGPLASHGALAVEVFFALSGFLIYRPFTRGAVPSIDYLLRRVVRIIPGIAVAIVGIGLLLPGGYPWLMVVLWTLLVEATFYASLPLFARLVRRHELVVVIALTVPSLAVDQLLGPIQLPGMLLLIPLLAPAWWWAFGLGMALALIERDRPDLLRPRVLTAAGILLLVAGIAVLDRLPTSISSDVGALPIVLSAVGIMGASINWRPTTGAKAATLAADISYPFYLWHAPVLAALSPVATGYPMLAAALAVTAAASTVSVLCVERPVRRVWTRSRAASRARLLALTNAASFRNTVAGD